MTEWDTFWAAYPRKVGKLAAEKAYRKARTRATQEQLMTGLRAYLEHKPSYADWCHPQTWLNSGRWLDEWAPVEPQRRGCGHEPPCRTGEEHVAVILAEQRALREQEAS